MNSMEFKKHRHDLLEVVENAFQLVTRLVLREVVPEATQARVLSLRASRKERSIALLDAIEARITLSPGAFHKLISLFQKDTILEGFAGKMLDSYRKCKRADATEVLYNIACTCNSRPFKSSILHANYAMCISSVDEFTATNSLRLLGNSTPTSKSITVSALARYSGYLRAHYKEIPYPPSFKWPPVLFKKRFNFQLVRHSNDRQNKTTSELRRIELEEVVPFPEEAQPKMKYILIEGDPGVGKTTLILDLCKRWDKLESTRGYSLVVLLRVQDRRVKEARNLADLFNHHNAELQHAVTQEVAATGGKRVLLIFDGLDQLVLPVHKNSLLMQVLQGMLLPEATILFTSRSSATKTLLSTICISHADRHVELLGFTDEEICQHAEAAFQHCPKLRADFQEYVSTNPAIRSVMHIPLNTAIVVQSFKEAATSGKAPLKTLTQLYNELTQHILKYYMVLQGIIDHKYMFPDSLTDLPPKIYRQLCTLGNLAFTALVKQASVFTKFPQGCQHMGFMNAFSELHTNKTICTSYSFLHLNLQEYLAAFHITQLSSAEQVEIFRDYSTLPHLEGMWRFLAGITGFESAIWDLVKAEMCQDATLSPFVLRCFYEAHERIACETVLNSSEMSFPQAQFGKEVLPLDCFAIGCCLAHSTCTLSLRLRLNTEMLHMLALGLRSSSTEVHSMIKTLFLRPPLSEQTVAQLGKLPLYILQGLDLSHSKLDPTTLDTLSTIIPKMVNLKHLDIRGNPLGKGGTVKLIQSLSHLNNLHSLNIINTGIGCDDIEALFSVISNLSALKELQLGDESMPVECINLLVCAVFSHSSLESVHIWLVNLEAHMNHLSEMLKDNSNITKLEFHGCKIGREGGQALANALTINTTLNTLIVSMFDVPASHQFSTGGALAMSEMLRVNQTLLHFELLFETSIGRQGALALVNVLQYNHTLKSIKLPQRYFPSAEIHSMNSRVEWAGP